MMKWNKTAAILLAACMLLGLCACGGKNDPAVPEKPEQETPQQPVTPAPKRLKCLYRKQEIPLVSLPEPTSPAWKPILPHSLRQQKPCP